MAHGESVQPLQCKTGIISVGKKQITESGEALVAYNTSMVDVHAACDMSSRGASLDI
jgi:hypothetical protein